MPKSLYIYHGTNSIWKQDYYDLDSSILPGPAVNNVISSIEQSFKAVRLDGGEMLVFKIKYSGRYYDRDFEAPGRTGAEQWYNVRKHLEPKKKRNSMVKIYTEQQLEQLVAKKEYDLWFYEDILSLLASYRAKNQ